MTTQINQKIQLKNHTQILEKLITLMITLKNRITIKTQENDHIKIEEVEAISNTREATMRGDVEEITETDLASFKSE